VEFSRDFCLARFSVLTWVCRCEFLLARFYRPAWFWGARCSSGVILCKARDFITARFSWHLIEACCATGFRFYSENPKKTATIIWMMGWVPSASLTLHSMKLYPKFKILKK
jgi:hypothetical protein